jgi:hypothetical protein
MTKAGGTFATIAAAAALVATIPLAAQAGNRYDGSWSVTINTTSGNCPSSLRYSVRVTGGRVLGDDPSYQVAGSVAPNGATVVRVSQSGQSASGSGRLSGNGGGGRWRTSTGECAGQWTAERRI